MALHRVGLDQNRPLTFRRGHESRKEKPMLVFFNPMSPSPSPINEWGFGETHVFLKKQPKNTASLKSQKHPKKHEGFDGLKDGISMGEREFRGEDLEKVGYVRRRLC